MDRSINDMMNDPSTEEMTRNLRPRALSDAEVKNQVIVVGGGLGGLATACTLAARGYAVVLCDKNSWTGGKAAVYEEGGFRFDMGPTILTIPAVLKRIFDEAGQPLESALDLVPLDPQWRSFFDDGTTLDLHADVEKMKAELEQFSPGSGAGEGYSRFMDLAKKLHKISDDFFFLEIHRWTQGHVRPEEKRHGLHAPRSHENAART
jgi:phytoene dehydrogenase-like protein